MNFFEWLKIILYMIAAIGALLIGFEMLSDNVTKLAHKGLKKLFNRTSKNKLVGVGIGTAATAIMQSSAATTVMVVGFVNTGIMTLYQATTIIMGANIGTTVTAQLAALSSFDFGAFAVAFAGIGIFISMFSKREHGKTIGHAFAGFGLLFLGLDCMSQAVKTPEVFNVISGVLSNIDGPWAPVLLFILGIALTALVQSSSLITTVVISLATAGIYIGSSTQCLNNNILFLILGTNIGTCVTALISSIGTSVNAKRASIIHLLFNTFGALIFIILLSLWPSFMESTFVKLFAEPATQIAMFHTFFNVICTLVFLPFVNFFVKTSELIIKDNKQVQVDDDRFKYIDPRMIKSPSIAIHQVRREMSLMLEKSFDALSIALDSFFQKDISMKEKVDEINFNLESKSKKIISFLVDLSNENITYDDECTVSSFHRNLNDILRIGEIGDNICKYTRHVVNEDLEFSENVLMQIGFMKTTINNLYQITGEIFLGKNEDLIPDADQIEEHIDLMRKELIDDHFERLNNGKCHPQNSGVFVNLVNNLERAADHLTYIGHSVQEAALQSLKG